MRESMKEDADGELMKLEVKVVVVFFEGGLFKIYEIAKTINLSPLLLLNGWHRHWSEDANDTVTLSPLLLLNGWLRRSLKMLMILLLNGWLRRCSAGVDDSVTLSLLLNGWLRRY